MTTPLSEPDDPDVAAGRSLGEPRAELNLPAESAYVSVLRMTTAGLAARLDFTLDDIEDLRMAVGEACALALDGAQAGGQMRTAFFLQDGAMRVEITATSTPVDYTPDRENFGWQVLTAITDDVSVTASPGGRAVGFTVRSSLRV